MTRTRKPCPGCAKVVSSRDADKVCHECKRAIDSWHAHVEKANSSTELETVRLKSAWHWYPGFYYGGPYHCVEGFEQTRDEMSRLFWELPELVCTEKLDWKDGRRKGDDKDYPFVYEKPKTVFLPKRGSRFGDPVEYPTSDGSGDYNATYGKIPKRLLEVIQALFDRTARFAEMSYLGGFQDGKDLLVQLGNGELTPSKIGEQDIRLAKKIQDSAYLHKQRRKVRL
jgi:hypothetical protein